MIKISLWIQFVAQLVLSGSAFFYLGHLRAHLHRTLVPGAIQGVIEFRSLLWVLPLVFGLQAFRLSRRPTVELPAVATFTAFSLLALACIIALGVWVTYPYAFREH